MPTGRASVPSTASWPPDQIKRSLENTMKDGEASWMVLLYCSRLPAESRAMVFYQRWEEKSAQMGSFGTSRSSGHCGIHTRCHCLLSSKISIMECFLVLSMCLRSDCFNEILWTGQFKQQHLILTVLDTEKFKIRMPAYPESVKGCLPSWQLGSLGLYPSTGLLHRWLIIVEAGFGWCKKPDVSLRFPTYLAGAQAVKPIFCFSQEISRQLVGKWELPGQTQYPLRVIVYLLYHSANH